MDAWRHAGVWNGRKREICGRLCMGRGGCRARIEARRPPQGQQPGRGGFRLLGCVGPRVDVHMHDDGIALFGLWSTAFFDRDWTGTGIHYVIALYVYSFVCTIHVYVHALFSGLGCWAGVRDSWGPCGIYSCLHTGTGAHAAGTDNKHAGVHSNARYGCRSPSCVGGRRLVGACGD